jgi:hypothetical protein
MLADSFGKLRAALDATPSFYRVGISLPRKLPIDGCLSSGYSVPERGSLSFSAVSDGDGLNASAENCVMLLQPIEGRVQLCNH